MNYMDKLSKWLSSSLVDENTKEELRNIKDEKEIEDRFYKNLEFGTGGLRGILGAGTNRMNVYTVAKASKGLAKYLLNTEKKPLVCIAYDSRLMSKEFADIVSRVMASSGIRVSLYKTLRPTPMLSFAVREKNANAGIMITASHNPAQYNGYKVYGQDGAQITDKAARDILDCIESYDELDDNKLISLEEAIDQGLISYMEEEIDNTYYEKVKDLIIRKDMVKRSAKDLKIVYTPIHGSGNIPVRTVLKQLSFENVSIVAEQELPDGNFPTAPYPNPEDKKVFDLAIKLANENQADIIMGTDPDCDRIGVVVKDKEGDYKTLTGNQVGNLLAEYILSSRKAMGIDTEKDTIIKTIVTSQMANRICKNYKAQTLNVLTGFKYIGEKIKEFSKTKSNNFVLGFEESYGYLAGDFVRDKDGVIAAAIIAEMALYYHLEGKTLYEGLEDLYKKYGYYKEELISIEMEGKNGKEKIDNIISTIRNQYPDQVAGYKVKEVEDYKTSIKYDLTTKNKEKLSLPQSNVIKIIFEDDSYYVIRPSGTEPKMKIYIAVVADSKKESSNKLDKIKEAITDIVK